MADGITPTVTTTPLLDPSAACQVTASDGSQITPPHTANSFGDRLECSTHPKSETRPPTAQLKVIGRERAVMHPKTEAASSAAIATSNSSTTHQRGDVLVRSDGSVDGAATAKAWKDDLLHVQQTFADPDSVQHHALQSLSINPIEKTEGTASLIRDAVHAAPGIAAAAPGAVASGAQSAWGAASDLAKAQVPGLDPQATQRTFDRMKGVYDATLGPLVSDAQSLGTTIAESPGSPTGVQDIGAASAATVVEGATFAGGPEVKGGELVIDAGVHAAENAAEHGAATSTAAATRASRDGSVAVPITAVANSSEPSALVRKSRNAGLPSELRTSSERTRKNAASSDPKVHALLGADGRGHHLIPVEVIRKNQKLFEAASKAGFHTDEPGNAMLLPKNSAAQDRLRANGFTGSEQRPIHDSGHLKERKELDASIDKVKAKLRRSGFKPGSPEYNQRAYDLIKRLEDETRQRLKGTDRVTMVPSTGEVQPIA